MKVRIGYFFLFFIGFVFFQSPINAQSCQVSGVIIDEKGNPLESVAILKDDQMVMVTDAKGGFRFRMSEGSNLVEFRILGFESKTVSLSCGSNDTIVLNTSSKILDDVEVKAKSISDSRLQAGLQEINPKVAKDNPLPFGDFTQILASLPGVIAPSEFSSAYAVRGGNYDENLVYVNDMMVYRPQLFTNGQQEGLSFINPDLVERVRFSSGGWSAMYGDRLSSNMLVDYKKPTKFGASYTLGLLGFRAHMEDASKSGRVNFLLGVRHKRAGYLLRTLELDGEYFPRFTDVQGNVNVDLSNKPNRENNLTFLLSYARNRYELIPRTRLSEFGNFFQSFRFLVGFQGREEMRFDTYMGGAKWEKEWTGKLRSQLISSVTKSSEREFYDIDGAYRLCDVDNDPSSATFNQCLVVRGVGRNYLSARNVLEMMIWQNESRWMYEFSKRHIVRGGVSHIGYWFSDRLQEYALIDSADFVSSQRYTAANNQISHHQLAAFAEYEWKSDSIHFLNVGLRVIHQTLNGQWLWSPRIQYSYRNLSQRDAVYRAAWGIYHQGPMYRELRDFDGFLNLQIRAQSSMHFIAGIDKGFTRWGRDFRLMTEVYYKHLYNIIPYDLDNIRVRYYGQNAGVGYATGVDFRVSGEFIPGDESWFSIGLLQTRENIDFDERGFIRRPTDQWLNLGILFQDHIPNNPSIRVMINTQIVTGFPFGPPFVPEFRSTSNSRTYRRVDLGFSKIFSNVNVSHVRDIAIGLDILNLIGANNVISYSWIQDVNGNGIAIPNTLSARFFNLKLSMNLE